MASRFLNSVRAAASSTIGAMAVATSASSSSFMLMEGDSNPPVTSTTASSSPSVYVAVFLDAKSRDVIKTKFPTPEGFKVSGNHLTLNYNPSDTEFEETYNKLMGKNATVVLHGEASDENIHTIFASVFDSEGNIVASESFVPHITVAHNSETNTQAVYSNVLLERLNSARRIVLQETTEGTSIDVENWTGTLPEFKSTFLNNAEVFPESKNAAIVLLNESIELSGIICSTERFDTEEFVCEPESDCGFCRFMKAGPCGQAFRGWEKCLEKCKEDGTEFIEECGPQTLALRDCVDLHPSYYSVLNEDKKENSEQSTSKTEKSEEKSSPVTKNSQENSPVTEDSKEKAPVTEQSKEIAPVSDKLKDENPAAAVTEHLEEEIVE